MIVPIVTDMVKCFLSKKEPYEIRMLAYKRYQAPLPLQPPQKLNLLFVDRGTTTRGIYNHEEIVELLSYYPGVFDDLRILIIIRFNSIHKSISNCPFQSK